MSTHDALPDFSDPAVQAIYGLLQEDAMPPNQHEHWDGWIARIIVAEVVQAEVARAVEAERERCATIAEDMDWSPGNPIAAAIREGAR